LGQEQQTTEHYKVASDSHTPVLGKTHGHPLAKQDTRWNSNTEDIKWVTNNEMSKTCQLLTSNSPFPPLLS
jgi:hypothetical protein